MGVLSQEVLSGLKLDKLSVDLLEHFRTDTKHSKFEHLSAASFKELLATASPEYAGNADKIFAYYIYLILL
jgi:hypothetical protein